MTDADKERSPKDESKRLLKVAATYSPTVFRSAVPSAMLPSPLLSALSRARAPLMHCERGTAPLTHGT